MTDDPADSTVGASRFARKYARLAPVMERRGAARHRAELLADVTGSVIEIGCGPGSMFRHYPASVSGVLAGASKE